MVFNLQSRHEYMVEMVQRAITPKVANQSYGSCVLHIILYCFTFVWSLVKISLMLSELWSRHEWWKRWRTDRWTDGRMDTQKFGGYNIIPSPLFVVGHKNVNSFWLKESVLLITMVAYIRTSHNHSPDKALAFQPQNIDIFLISPQIIWTTTYLLTNMPNYNANQPAHEATQHQ